MKKLRKVKCGCGCGRKFQQKVLWQLYLDETHKNRAAQARLRERAKGFPERRAEQSGAGVEA